MFKLRQVPEALYSTKDSPLLGGILRGAERECLRVTRDGGLSQNPHPLKLGSALTHPQITTDFSEALLEFITPPNHRLDDLFSYLNNIHQFVIQHIGDELLWPASMPCDITEDGNIPVAQYGTSNNGIMKTIYRIGLGHRYGRTMQTVAGVHYNFSLPNAFWALLHSQDNRLADLQEYKDEGYFGLIRNFRRHYWLLIYLFGASPAISNSFTSGRHHNLQPLNGNSTLHLPYATSLRMGDLGYQSSAQEELFVCYNQKESYIQTLCCAIVCAHPAYDSIGLQDQQNNYKQLNTSLLQIENEFYSAIRPKRTARPGETALSALNNRGVEYIEVRCLDTNPFEPEGITREQVRFLDTFLVYCALQDSPASDLKEFELIMRNQKAVVNLGRTPNLMLDHYQSGKLSLEDWGLQLLEAMRPVAELMDAVHQCEEHQQSLEAQKDKVLNPAKTLSAQILNELTTSGKSFNKFTLDLAQNHKEQLSKRPIDKEQFQRLAEMAEESLMEQKALEEPNQIPFKDFLKNYYSQYTHCSQSVSDCVE